MRALLVRLDNVARGRAGGWARFNYKEKKYDNRNSTTESEQ